MISPGTTLDPLISSDEITLSHVEGLARTPRRSVGSICGIPLVEVPALPPGVLAILADLQNPTGAVALLADGTVLGPRQTPLRTA